MADFSSPSVSSLAIRSADTPTVANTFGAWMICSSIGCMLFGLTTHQTYRYFRLYPSDGWGLKFLVISLLIMDTFHSISNIHLCYYYLVINYANPIALVSGVWSLRLTIAETGCVMMLSHLFFIRRIYLLGGKRLAPAVFLTSLVFTELGLAIAMTVMTFILVTFSGFKPYSAMIWVLLANGVLLDVLITGFLSFYLWRSRTGFRRTDSIVDVLMVYTINTGLSTSVLTIPAMFCSIFMPDNLIWSSLYVIASKMYANSLLAVLNSRRSIIDKGMEGFETGSFGLQVFEGDGGVGVGVRHYDCFKSPSALRSPQDVNVNVRFDSERDGASPAKVAHDSELALPEPGINVNVTTETFVDISPRGPHVHHRSAQQQWQQDRLGQPQHQQHQHQQKQPGTQPRPADRAHHAQAGGSGGERDDEDDGRSREEDAYGAHASAV